MMVWDPPVVLEHSFNDNAYSEAVFDPLVINSAASCADWTITYELLVYNTLTSTDESLTGTEFETWVNFATNADGNLEVAIQ